MLQRVEGERVARQVHYPGAPYQLSLGPAENDLAPVNRTDNKRGAVGVGQIGRVPNEGDSAARALRQAVALPQPPRLTKRHCDGCQHKAKMCAMLLRRQAAEHHQIHSLLAAFSVDAGP